MAVDQSITLVNALAISSSSNSTSADSLARYTDLFGQLNCSAVPTGGAPTLDVYLQTSADNGSTWQDIAHFQFTTAAVSRFFRIAGGAAGETTTFAASDAALAGDTVKQGPWGDQLRVKWVFAAGGSTGIYTLTVTVVAKGAGD